MSEEARSPLHAVVDADGNKRRAVSDRLLFAMKWMHYAGPRAPAPPWPRISEQPSGRRT